jgi:hypothetical protein
VKVIERENEEVRKKEEEERGGKKLEAVVEEAAGSPMETDENEAPPSISAPSE